MSRPSAKTGNPLVYVKIPVIIKRLPCRSSAMHFICTNKGFQLVLCKFWTSAFWFGCGWFGPHSLHF